jgi:hypothetical protein
MHMYQICLMKVKYLTKFITHMIKVSNNSTHHLATAILHDTFFSIREFISSCGVMLLVAVNSIFTVFYHEHFSVFLRKGKDFDMLYSLLYFH